MGETDSPADCPFNGEIILVNPHLALRTVINMKWIGNLNVKLVIKICLNKIQVTIISWASQVVLVVKNLLANAGDLRYVGLIPGLGRSSGEGNGNPLQYSCLENPHGQRSRVGYSL